MRRLLLGLAIATIAALSPCWVHADDQQIAQQIVQQLRQQKAGGQLAGFGIDLEVESGIVWLKGHVRSAEQQKLVLDIARRVSGVQQVVNDLQVNTAATAKPKQQVKPAVLRTESKSKLLKKPGQLLTNLRGSVQRAFKSKAKKRAERKTSTLAKSAPAPAKSAPAPAKSVPTPARTLLASAQTELAPPELAQPELASPKLVQPSPTRHPVQTRSKRLQAAPVSKAKSQRPSDTQLAEVIIGKLRTQKDRGILRNFDVDVQVNDQVVWVSGRVATEAQRSLVLDISRRVRGVKQVVNDLSVAAAAPVTVASATRTAPVTAVAPVTQEPLAPVGTAVARPQAPAPFRYAPAPQARPATRQVPMAFAPARSVAYTQQVAGQPVAEYPAAAGVARARFDNPSMPGYAWPSYAAYPNYGAVTYPRQYSPTAWPYIGPFYPYPQVPLGWRKVTLEWDDGWWMLDFKSK